MPLWLLNHFLQLIFLPKKIKLKCKLLMSKTDMIFHSIFLLQIARTPEVEQNAATKSAPIGSRHPFADVSSNVR
jgi:hypothetical protein